MKKILLASILSAAYVLAGCSDFLEVENKGQLTSDNFWQTEKQVQQGLTAAYAALQTFSGDKWDFFEEVYIGLTYRADDINNNQAESYGAKLASFTFTTEESTNYKLWLSCYAGIARANQVIEETGHVLELSEAQQKAYIGEAKFLRAYNYFMLVNHFINVPKITTYKDQVLRPEQADPAEIWTLIESDLADAEVNVDESHDDVWKGRATKWTAKALLGKVYLYQEKWALAETKFKEVVDANVYSLLPAYGDNFNGNGENGPESVFEIQFTANRSGGVDERHPFNWEVSPSALDGWQLFYPSDWLMTEMLLDKTAGGQYSDRVYESVFFDDPNSEMRPPTEEYFVLYADVKNDLTFPYYFKKYSAWTDRTGSYVGTNISVIRYADVLLMYAEALNENNKTTEAIDQVNVVRQRSNAEDLAAMTKDALRTQIRHHERPVELSMEYGIRWMDLMRWNRGSVATESIKTTLTNHGKVFAANFVDGKHDKTPIPFQEMSLNPNLDQNPGW